MISPKSSEVELDDLPDADALFVALVLAPGTFPRNKFFELYKEEDLMSARRRARIVRSLVKDLTEPWPHPGRRSSHAAPIVEERTEKDGRLQLSYRVDEFHYRRSATLTVLEAATLNYALSQAGAYDLPQEEQALVEGVLRKLSPQP